MSLIRKCGFCPNVEKEYGDFKVCSRCKTVNYCCVECQKNDWKVHKKSCKTIKNINNLKDFLNQKRTSVYNEKLKDKSRAEIISLWAREYFKCNANKDSEQLVVVRINSFRNIADFLIDSETINQAKQCLKQEQLDMMKNSDKLFVLIFDQGDRTFVALSQEKVTQFETGVYVVDFIEM